MLEINNSFEQNPFKYMAESDAKHYCNIIRLIQRHENIPYLVEISNDLEIMLFIPCNWFMENPKSIKKSNNFIIIKDMKYTELDMNKVEVIKDVEMLSHNIFDGKVSPTLYEIFSQIPVELLDKVVAFELIKKNGSVIYLDKKYDKKSKESNYYQKNKEYYHFDIRLYKAKL